ncbi:MAG: acyl-CoA dehydrogenase family protein [Cyanobacteria bacterium P01_G01_bin.49]
MNDSEILLETVHNYLQDCLSSEIDQDPAALKKALQGLTDRSLLSVKIPKAWGGLGVDSETFYLFQQLIARYSGALAFLQLQHQGAVSSLVSSENELLKQQYLPQIVQGKQFIGQGFSQLRRQGEPLVKAIPISGGYYISGHVPWITGFGFFDAFIIGAILPDGKELRGIIPCPKNCETIKFSGPMKLCAMQSTNTVTATLDHYFLPTENVIIVQKKGAIHENDKKVVLFPSFLILGCAKAGLDIIEKTSKTKQLDFIENGFNKLNDEFNQCQTQILEAMRTPSTRFEENLKLRVWAINLAQRCSQAAVTVSSGAANYLSHPAQRVYREALVFTVFAQTTDLMKATLERLIQAPL